MKRILTILVLVACRNGDPTPVSDASVPAALRAGVSDSLIPGGPLGVSIRRGRAILAAPADSLPNHVGNGLRCVSCHLENGTRRNAMPWLGVYARFPQYRARSGRVDVLQDRINDCFQRSLNGSKLPAESQAMRDIVAYMAFLSIEVPTGGSVTGQGLPKMEPLRGDTARGAAVYVASCARCHGASGEGSPLAPPLWGKSSYTIGAGMARLRTASSFIRHNMPFDRPGTLSDQQAFDVAAYINSRMRPDFPGKENDWPNGDPPPDVAYQTRASLLKR